MSPLMRHCVAGQLKYAQRDHLVPGALHQFLQALPGRHLRADQDHLERGQPHRRLPPLRRGHQGDPHRMPHRRRRPQSLSRLRGADRRRPCRHRGEAGAAEAVRRRRLPGGAAAGDPEDACARRRRRMAKSKMLKAALRRGCRSSTTSTPPGGSSSNTTAASRTGNCTGVRAVLTMRCVLRGSRCCAPIGHSAERRPAHWSVCGMPAPQSSSEELRSSELGKESLTGSYGNPGC